MVLDREFEQEVRKTANGDGSREYKFAFWKQVRAAKEELSNTKAAELFDECVRKHGRVIIALCVAETLIARKDRLDNAEYGWALKVIDLWTNKPRDISGAAIDDGIHPTRILDYAGDLIKITKIE